MSVQKKVELLLDHDLKRVLIHSLENYQRVLEERLKTQKFTLARLFISDEILLIQSFIKQINDRWKESLPTIAESSSFEEKNLLVKLLNHLRDRRTGAIYGITKDKKVAQITYNDQSGFVLKVENVPLLNTFDTERICDEFCGLC
jgi:hypothetical protein